MSKRTAAWVTVALVGVLSIGGMLWGMFGTSKVVFSESELQTRLNQQLPRTAKDVTIARVVVSLADNRLALRMDLQSVVLRQPVSAVVSARGVPRYSPHNEAMYFDADEIKINRLTIDGKTVVGDEETAAHSRLADAVGPTVQRLAEVAAKTYLAALPVYHFKNDVKGFLLKAALSGVTIEQDKLAVTFSLWNLTVTAGIFALILAIVMLVIYFLIRDPLWGVGMIADVATVNHPAEIPVAIGSHLFGKLMSMGDKAERQKKAGPEK
jgi:hypothetical protein